MVVIWIGISIAALVVELITPTDSLGFYLVRRWRYHCCFA